MYIYCIYCSVLLYVGVANYITKIFLKLARPIIVIKYIANSVLCTIYLSVLYPDVLPPNRYGRPKTEPKFFRTRFVRRS